MSGAPGGDYVNALRWFKHLTSFAAAESAKFGKADFEVVVGGGGKGSVVVLCILRIAEQ